MRSDLKMSKGKAAAQAGHAAVSSADEARRNYPKWWKAWIREGQCKIVVKVENEKKLIELKQRAEELKLPNFMIVDRGLTELPPNSLTCLGIGPAPSHQIDGITANLKLF